MVFVIFSFMGTEVIAVTAGKPRIRYCRAARDALDGRAADPVLPGRDHGAGRHRPWTAIQPGRHHASPFVRVFRLIASPPPRTCQSVVITAAASSMNCNLYLTSRMMFSSRAVAMHQPTRPAHSPRRSPQRSPRLGRRSRRRPAVSLSFPRALCLSLWDLALRRPVRVAHDLHHAPVLPPRWESLGRPALPVRMIGTPIPRGSASSRSSVSWSRRGGRGDAGHARAGLPWLAALTIAYLVVARRALGSPERRAHRANASAIPTTGSRERCRWLSHEHVGPRPVGDGCRLSSRCGRSFRIDPGIVFGLVTVYVALEVGLNFSASIPIASSVSRSSSGWGEARC